MSGPPKGAVASPSDFRIKRDEQGELLPVWEPIPGTKTTCSECEGSGTVVIEPPTDNESEDPEPEFVNCENCDGRGYTPRYAHVVPLEQGAANKYLPKSGDPSDMSDRKTAMLLNDRFVEPSFDLDVNNAEEAMNEFMVFGVEPLILCIYNASGFEIAKGMIVENSEITEAVKGNSKNGS